jgi:hypothetical protein
MNCFTQFIPEEVKTEVKSYFTEWLQKKKNTVENLEKSGITQDIIALIIRNKNTATA